MKFDNPFWIVTVDSVRNPESEAGGMAIPEVFSPPQADLARRSQPFRAVITSDPAMVSLISRARCLAQTGQTVLLSGETGTGKELMARAIHKSSGRSGRFVTVNAAGLDESLFTDTLFGHVRGAYSSATEARNGALREAQGGTVFLDEIGCLPQSSQIKLLRLIETGEYYPLGNDTKKVADVRFILATNHDLREQVRLGRFRKDLYFRINTHELRLPPLRDRSGDIPGLLNHFATEAREQLDRPNLEMDPAVLPVLMRYPFPGNVRELRSFLLRAAADPNTPVLTIRTIPEAVAELADIDRIPPGEVVLQTGAEPHAADLGLHALPTLPTLAAAQDLLITEALRRCGGNQTRAARLLGISKQALNGRLSRKRNEMGVHT